MADRRERGRQGRSYGLPNAMIRLGVAVLVSATLFFLVGCGTSSDSSSDKPATTKTSKTTASQPKSNLATKGSFTRCVKKAGVKLDSSGAVPGDPNRTQRPRGLKDPVAEAEYIGAA